MILTNKDDLQILALQIKRIDNAISHLQTFFQLPTKTCQQAIRGVCIDQKVEIITVNGSGTDFGSLNNFDLN